MPQAITQCEERREQGFDLFVLRNNHVELSVVPALGAKVVSLKSSHTGREWLWSASPERTLFRNHSGDAFEKGPLIGWDECLPTIAACRFAGRVLPDHGEAWQAEWLVDANAWRSGTLRTSLQLEWSPVAFSRSLTLSANEAVVDYTLTSRSSQPERFIWAMHPLFAIHDGDTLELPPAARTALGHQEWMPELTFKDNAPGCAKCFIPAGMCRDGVFSKASMVNSASGDKLTIEWNAAENDTLGLWLTRGGWHGHHHLALEPTNGATDSLAATAEQNHCGVVFPGTSKTWRVIIRLENTHCSTL